ncbi:MAG: hypothetical protein V4448_06915 [Pseudomonadota bacterium]
MKNNTEIQKAIFNMGGPKIAGLHLQVSTSTISKWVRNGIIPNLNKAQQVSEASGFPLETLRPRFETEAVM